MSEAIDPKELAARLRGDAPPRLLDVREPDEQWLAALPGATLIPLGQLPVRHAEIAAWKAEETVVFCHHGVRSRHAIAFLRSLGFTRLINLTGGIDQWSVRVDPGVRRY